MKFPSVTTQKGTVYTCPVLWGKPKRNKTGFSWWSWWSSGKIWLRHQTNSLHNFLCSCTARMVRNLGILEKLLALEWPEELQERREICRVVRIGNEKRGVHWGGDHVLVHWQWGDSRSKEKSTSVSMGAKWQAQKKPNIKCPGSAACGTASQSVPPKHPRKHKKR